MNGELLEEESEDFYSQDSELEAPEFELEEQAPSSALLDSDLVLSVIQAESAFNPQAKSSAGAQGLMQLMPANSRKLGVEDPYDPQQNISGGIALLREELDRFGSLPLAIAAYNAGSPAVLRAIGQAGSRDFRQVANYLPEETKAYVPRVLDNYAQRKSVRQDDAQTAKRGLKKVGTGTEFATELENLITGQEFSQYAPVDQIRKISELYDSRKWAPRANEIMRRVTNEIWKAAPAEQVPPWGEIIGNPIKGANEEEIRKSSGEAQGKFSRELKAQGVNVDLFGDQFYDYFKQLEDEEVVRSEVRNRGFLELVGEGLQSVGAGATRTFTSPAAAVARQMGFGETADALSAAPQSIFGEPAREYLYRTNPDGSIQFNTDGQPITTWQGTVLDLIGGFGSFFLTGGALAAAKGANAVKAFALSQNTLSAMDQAFIESREAGATDEDAMHAAYIAAPVAAATSFVDAHVIAGNKFWIHGLTGQNKARGMAQQAIESAALSAAGNAVADLGVQYGVNQVTGKPIDPDRVAFAATVAAVPGGFFGAQAGLNFKPTAPIYAKPTVEAPPAEVSSAPGGPARTAELPAPGERPGLPLPRRYETGDPILVPPEVPPDTQIALAERLERFQQSSDKELVLDFSSPNEIPSGLLNTLAFEASRISDSQVLISKRETYQPPIVENDLIDVDGRIAELTNELDQMPRPESARGLIEERSRLKKQLYQTSREVRAFDSRDNALVTYRREVGKAIEKNRKERRGTKDKNAIEILDREYDSLRTEYEGASEQLKSPDRKAAQTQNRILEINDQLKELQDPAYVNNLKSRERELQGLLSQRTKLLGKAEGFVEPDDRFNLAVKVKTEAGPRYVLPYRDAWYVLDAQGRAVTDGDWNLGQALDKARQVDAIPAVEVEPVRPGTSYRATPAKIKIQRGRLDIIEKQAQNFLPHEIQKARQRFNEAVAGIRDIEKARPVPPKVPKKKKGAPVPQEGEMFAGSPQEQISTSEAPESVQALRPDPFRSAERVYQKQARFGVGSEFERSEVVAAPAEPISTQQILKSAEKALQQTGTKVPVSITLGARMPRGVWGAYQFVRKYIRNDRYNDPTTIVHETAHAIDDYVLSRWDSKGVGDYSDLPPEVRKGLIDTARNFYGASSIVSAPEHLQLAEGFSTFLEMLSSGQKVHKDVLNWFRTDFAEKFPKQYEALNDLVKLTQQWAVQTPAQYVEQFRSAQANESDFAKSLKKLAQRDPTELISKWIDSGAILKSVDEEIFRVTGERTRLQEAFYAAKKRASNLARYNLSETIIDLDGNKLSDTSFEKIIEPLSSEQRSALENYMVAKRAATYLDADLDPGMNEKDILLTIRETEISRPEITSAANAWWDAWGTFRRGLANSSESARALYDRETANNLALTGTEHGFYLPFQREGKGTPRLGTKRTGSTRRIVSPFGNLGTTMRGLIEAHLRARTLEQTIKTISNAKGSPYLGALARPILEKARLQTLEAETKGKAQDFLKATKFDEDQRKYAEDYARFALGVLAPDMTSVKAPDGYDIVALPLKDKTVYYEVRKDLTEIFDDSFSAAVNNPVVNALIYHPKVLFQRGATSLRPAFAIPNFFRDLGNYIVRTEAPLTSPNIVLDLMKGFSESTLSKVGLKSLTKWADTIERLGLEISDFQNPEVFDAKLKGSGYKVVDFLNKPLNAISTITSIGEQAPRVAAFIAKARALGLSPDDSFTQEQAVELIRAFRGATTDYTIQGSSARSVNRVTPFFTARIANTAQSLQDFKRHPERAAIKAASWLALGVAYYQANKDREWYQNLDPAERMTAYLEEMGVDGDKVLAKVALDSMASWAFGLGQMASEQFDEQDLLKPGVSEWMEAFVKGSSPIEIGFSLEENAEALSQFLGPIGREWVQQEANEDFHFDKPIDPESLKYLPAEERFTPYTTELSKWLGEKIGYSPARIDHAIRSMMPAAMDGIRVAERNLIDKQLRSVQDRSGLEQAIVNSFLRYELANETFGRSEKKFYEALDKAQADKDIEDPAQEKTRSKLEEAQKSLSYVNTVLRYGKPNREERDRLLALKSQVLKEALVVLEGKPQGSITKGPKQQAKKLKKEDRTRKIEARRARRARRGGSDSTQE